MTLYHFFSLLKKYKLSLFVAITLMVAESLVSLSVPWFVGKFSASILDGKTIFNLSYIQIALIWLSLFVLQALLRFLSTYKVNFMGAKMLTELSCRLYEHIQLLPVKYFSNTKKGETLALLSNDVTIISYFFSGVLTSLVPTTLILCGALILMASINITITFIIMLMVPAFFVVLKLLGRGIRPISESLVQRQADAMAIASENLSIITLVKAFSREKNESNRFNANAHEIQKLRKKQLKTQAILSPTIQLLVSTGILIVVMVSVMHYQSGELTMPDIITLLMYGMLFARPMSALANLYGQTQQALGASNRLKQIFSVSPEPSRSTAEVKTANNMPTNNDLNGVISFKEVNFSYEPSQQLLLNVNIDVQPNQTVIIVGPNGTGKSTLLHLLIRFIEPTAGQISIGGKPLSQFDLSALRSSIGFVSQDIALCSGSVADNIAFGYPQASFDEIELAAKKAGAHQFISALEHGYKTQVGENGVLLSGGQRQRISFARALMTDPQILLLDEPTSMIDSEARTNFKDNFNEVLKNKTVIIVSHEQSLADIADQVFIMQDHQLIPKPLLQDVMSNEPS
ncbi:MAG: ABC transporter ATP-binding protein [Colwellia sp.]|nr:ABC transporter ATP-binding protein [Colwellia sp.]